MRKLNIIRVQAILLKRNMSIITPLDFSRIFHLSIRSTYAALARYTKRGVMGRLKKGLYYLKINPPSSFEIANTIYRPSYISLESALSYYKIIPETIYALTSVTTKHTKEFKILNQIYQYHKIDKSFYFGYSPREIRNKIILMADKEKALADYFYFVFLRLKEPLERFNLRDIDKEKLSLFFKFYSDNVKIKEKKSFKNLISQFKLL